MNESRTEHADLERQLELRTRELANALDQQAAIDEILRVISSSPTDVQPVLDAVAKNAAHLCDAQVAGVFLAQGSMITPVASYSADAGTTHDRVGAAPLSRGSVTGRSIIDRKTMHLPDVLPLVDSEFPDTAPNQRRFGFRALLSVPLIRDGEAYGAIFLYRREPGFFAADQVALVETFARQAAIAIDNVRLFNDTKEALERQTATSEVLEAISGAQNDASPVFETIARNAHRLSGAVRCNVLRYEGGLLHIAACHGFSPEDEQQLRRRYPVKPADASVMSGRVLRSGAVEQIDDALCDPSYDHEHASTLGLRRMLGVPMLRDGAVLGVIVLAWREPGQTPAALMDLLETFAEQAVIAIENVRLFNETKEALEQQTAISEILRLIAASPGDVRPMLNAVAERALKLCNAAQAVIVMVEGNSLRYAAGFGNTPTFDESEVLPLTRGLVAGRAILDRVTIHLEDLANAPEEEFPDARATQRRIGHRALLAVPLMREDRAIGAISVWRMEPVAFTEKQIALIKTFADQAAIAIENVRLFNETQEALEQQTAISEILRVISGSPGDVQPMLDAVVERALRLCDAAQSGIFLVDGDGLRFAARFGTMLTPDYGERFPLSRGLVVGRAIIERQTIHHPDMAALVDDMYPDAREPQRKFGFRALLAIPLMREDRAIGAIALWRTEARAFTHQQIALVRTFAEQAAIAIENVRLFNETKEALQQQTAISEILRLISSSPADVQPMLDAVADRALKLCGAVEAGIFLAEGDTLRFAAGRGDMANFEEGARLPMRRTLVVGRAVLDRVLIHLPDIVPLLDTDYPDAKQNQEKLGFRALLAVPLMREDRAIGAIALWRLEPQPFTGKQIALVKTFADQAAIAIENVRLFNETKEALDQQTAISEILRVISDSPGDVQPMLDAVAERALTLCDAAEATILLVEGDALRFASGFGRTPTMIKGEGMPLSRGSVTGRAVVDRTVIHIEDLAAAPEDEYPVGRELQRRFGHHAILSVPLMREDRAIGAIALWRMEAQAFTDKQIALVKTFADQAAIAIENVRLFNATKEALEQQTAVAEILRVISASPTDVLPVLDAIAERAARHCDASAASMYLTDGNVLRHLASKGPSPDPVSHVDSLPINRDTLTGRALLDGATIQVPDLLLEGHEFPASHAIARRLGHRSVVVTPLYREGHPFGAILLRRNYVKPFSDREIALLRTFGDQAAIALENVRLFNETKEALDQQRASGEVLATISSSIADTGPVFERIVASCERLFGGTVVAINLVGDDGLLRSAAYHGPGRDELDRVFPAQVDDQTGTGIAITERRFAHYPDIEADTVPENARRVARATGLKAVVFVPMIWEGRGVGAIVVGRPTVGPFSDSDLALLKTFADQAVIAIQNARLFNETTEALDQQRASSEVLAAISNSIADTQPVFDKILESCERLFAGKVAGINLVEEDGLIHLGAYHGPNREELERVFPLAIDRRSGSGTAVLTRSVLHYPDVTIGEDVPEISRRANRLVGFKSVVYAPMVWEGRAIGVIFVGRDYVGSFSEKEIALLKTFADQAVIAIQNARLVNETREALDQQRASGEVLAAISNSIADTTPVFDKILASCERLFTGKVVGIRIVGDDGLVRMAAYHGPGRELVEQSSPRRADNATATGRAIRTREVQHFPDVEHDPNAPEALRLGLKYGVKASIHAPMLWEGRGIGAIFVGREQAGPFSDKEIALLKTFADQAVIAIQNARLVNETREALDQQRASGEVLATISSSIADTTPVFERILESCERLFAGTVIAIEVVGDDGSIRIEKFRGPGRPNQEGYVVGPVLAGASISANAILSRSVQHVPDIVNGSGVPAGSRKGYKDLGVGAAIVAPMLWEGRGIGCISVARDAAGPFSDKDIALLKTFADQAVIAIQNARLFREIEDKSRELEVANKHKSEFLANMSHELRTPLNAIIGFSEVLLEKLFGEVNAKQEDYLKDIYTSGKHLLGLINDILDLSKVEAGRMDLELAEFDLPAALSNALTLVRERAQRHNVALHLDIDPALTSVTADERKLKQILVNLLTNAVKFTPDGGRIDVVARRGPDAFTIAVRDTGIGIAPEDHEAVFEEFRQVGRDYTRKQEGTGLGLTLTRKFVELHGGRIWVESELGKGSTFTFTIPLEIAAGGSAMSQERAR